MASKRKSRKRRTGAPHPAAQPAPTPRGYERSRAKDDAARAALKPLRRGERPGAVTVGAIAAGALALANLIALVFGYNPSEDTLSPGSRLSGGAVSYTHLTLPTILRV